MESNIIKEIKNLKKDISPRPKWVNLSRDILLQQINPQEQYKPVHVGFFGYSNMFMQVFRQQMLEPAVIMLLLLGVFLGSSLTINAAFYSLPGDNLYRVKLALERTHVALVSNEEKKVELKVEFAQKRLAEFDKIVQQVNIDPQKRQKNINVAVQELKNNVVSVNDQLNKINKSIKESDLNNDDKEKTVRMAVSLNAQTEKLAKSIDETVEDLSEVEKLEVDEVVAQAVQSAQQLVEDTAEANQPTEEPVEDPVEGDEEGTVKGAEIQDDDTSNQETSTSKDKEDEETTVQDPDPVQKVEE